MEWMKVRYVFLPDAKLTDLSCIALMPVDHNGEQNVILDDVREGSVPQPS